MRNFKVGDIVSVETVNGKPRWNFNEEENQRRSHPEWTEYLVVEANKANFCLKTLEWSYPQPSEAPDLYEGNLKTDGYVHLVKAVDEETKDKELEKPKKKRTRKASTKEKTEMVTKQAAPEQPVGVVNQGKEIILPVGMSFKEAIKWLERREQEAETKVAISETIEAYPLDGAMALTKAMAARYGWTDLVPTPGMFGPKPPTMVGVEIDVGKVVQVPWGRFQIPGVDGWLSTGWGVKEGNLVFVLQGEVKQRHKDEVSQLAQHTRDLVKSDSIYKGKAIRLNFPEEDNFDPSAGPKFLDIGNTDLIFSDATMRQIETSLFTPIEKTEECRKYKVPLKRGILLEGPYGTGKTLTAYASAKKCRDHGWTFIYISTVVDLEKAINFAKNYEPAMIFAEDIDRVTEGERSHEMDAILNTLDGVISKNAEVMVVLTTNHIEKINRAMLRPGRLDAVISIQAPDTKAVENLLRNYGRQLLSPTEDLLDVAKKLQGQIPAVIREVVERAKLASIGRKTQVNETLKIDSEDLMVAAESMLNHLSFLQPKQEDKTHPFDTLTELLANKLGKEFTQKVSEVVEPIVERVVNG